MKKVVSLFAMVLVLGTASFAQSNGENQAKAKARVAAKACISNFSNVLITVTDNFICNDIGNVGNMDRTVTFYNQTPCNGNVPCTQSITPLARVEIGCDGNVKSVSCLRATE